METTDAHREWTASRPGHGELLFSASKFLYTEQTLNRFETTQNNLPLAALQRKISTKTKASGSKWEKREAGSNHHPPCAAHRDPSSPQLPSLCSLQPPLPHSTSESNCLQHFKIFKCSCSANINWHSSVASTLRSFTLTLKKARHCLNLSARFWRV